MEDSYNKVFENNKKWIEDNIDGDDDFFKNLSKGQSPDFLYIGCSDSRVPANHIMGLEPGEVFVHRNIANLVIGADLNCHSVIQYAVQHLKVKHIVVCGHYGCGGVQAAMQQQDMGMLNQWLSHIRDTYRLNQDELDAIEDESKRNDRLVELNVQEQCINVYKSIFVQDSIEANNSPSVHGWVYSLESGELIDLKLDFSKIRSKFHEIYRLKQ